MKHTAGKKGKKQRTCHVDGNKMIMDVILIHSGEMMCKSRMYRLTAALHMAVAYKHTHMRTRVNNNPVALT